MAATLPPIDIIATPTKSTILPPIKNNAKLRRDKTIEEKNAALRAQMPTLKKKDIAKFRNSYKHNLCLDMLTEGYHLSFCELVNLIRQQMERREAAGPESFLWTRPILQDQTEKLDMVKYHLTTAEAASRCGNFAADYSARYALAQFFSVDSDDQWLADHFFSTCLEVSLKVEGDEGKMEAEGHCNVGLCLQNNRKFNEAAKHFEAYHRLAKDHKSEWKTKSGVPFYTDSCVKLYEIYTIIGTELGKSGEEEDVDSSLDTLTNALEMAKESQDAVLEGEASYTLGMAYQKHNQLDTALTHLFNFYESCKGDSNSEGIGRACDSIAKIYARQGNKERSVEFLKRFVELTEKTGLEKEYCLACHNLGNVCNSVGNYDEATEYFSKAYNISRALNDPESTNLNRVQYGIAMAHRMMGQFQNHVVISDKECMSRLVEWRSVRTDNFSKPIPDAVPGAAHHVVLAVLPPAEGEEPQVEEPDTQKDTDATESKDDESTKQDQDLEDDDLDETM